MMRIQFIQWGSSLTSQLMEEKHSNLLEDLHVDHHGLWIDPANSNYLLNVQDGGLTISYDRGKTGNFQLKSFLWHSFIMLHMISVLHSGFSDQFRIITAFMVRLIFQGDAIRFLLQNLRNILELKEVHMQLTR